MTTNTMLKEYRILSVLGLPFFAVKNDEEKSELQTTIKLKLKEVSGLTLIPEPSLSKAEEYFDGLADKRKKCKKWAPKRAALFTTEVFLISYFILKHFVIRIGIKKQICEEEVRMFYETTTEAIEYSREKKIKQLAGIE